MSKLLISEKTKVKKQEMVDLISKVNKLGKSVPDSWLYIGFKVPDKIHTKIKKRFDEIEALDLQDKGKCHPDILFTDGDTSDWENLRIIATETIVEKDTMSLKSYDVTDNYDTI